MKNGNGIVKKVGISLIGIVLASYLGYMVKAQFVLADNMIKNDNASRERDTEILHEQNERFNHLSQAMNDAVLEQTTTNGRTNVVLERILVKLETIENGS